MKSQASNDKQTPNSKPQITLKRFYLFVAVTTFVGSAYGQSELAWRTLPFSPTASSRHDDVFFVNPNLGWTVNGGGLIHRTTNGGASWQLQIDVPEYVRSVGFADSLRGWAGTLSGTNPLYHTTNSGTTWELVSNIPDPRPDGICGIWVVDDSVVYASGEYDGPAIVIKSTDRGATWISMDLAGLADRLVDCYFTSPDSGFVVGSKGGSGFADGFAVILHTTNGGTTWTTPHTGTRGGELCWKISFPTRDVGYVSIEDFVPSSVYFLKTVDGGNTWQEKIFLNSFADEQGIGFATPTLGWIGGWENSTYQTTDGGETWQVSGFGENVNRIRFLSDTLGYAVGRRVYKFSRGGTTPVEPQDDNELPSDVVLLQNYPNPFNPNTTIRFALPVESFVRLSVYDILSQEVATLANDTRPAGYTTIEWNGENWSGVQLASGVYFYRLDATSTDGHHTFNSVRKLVVLK